jgi:hypothetical protein
MSNKTTNDATVQSTKQMLDELDALMAKMLSLPVNDPDEAPPFPQEVVKAPTLTPTLSATLTLLEPPARTAPTTENYLSEPEPSSHPAVNPPHIVLPPEVREAAPQPEPLTNDVIPPSVMPDLKPLLEQIPESATARTTQWGYMPLLWINQGFDRSTTMLGGAGDWLRSQAGRMLLGVSGIAMMVIAVAWFLKDWLGWN